MNEIQHEESKRELLKRLKERRSLLWKNPTVTIGTHGIPNSGKTANYVGLYLNRDTTQLGLTIRFDEESLIYLRSMAEHFVENGRMEATGARSPKDITFTITTDQGPDIRIKTMDLAGRFVEPGGAQDVGAEARKFIARCDAIFCFADCRCPTHSIMDAIDLLPQNSTILFMPTKIDEMLEDPEELLGQDGQQVAEIYGSLDLGSAHSLDQCLKARWPANRYKCVPMAALGPIYHRGELRVSLPVNLQDLRPWNLFVPWQMVAKAKIRELKYVEQELDRKIEVIETEIKAAHQKSVQKKDIQVEKRVQRETTLKTRLEEIENDFTYSLYSLPLLLALRMELQHIETEAAEENWNQLAKRASRTRGAIQSWLTTAIVISLGGLLLLSQIL